jgi:hypothetical protein
MSLEDLEPFEGISIRTTAMDAREVAHLLQKQGCRGLMCQKCGGERFVVSAIIPAELEILSGDEAIAIAKANFLSVKINQVLKCAHCGCEKFTQISERITVGE